MNFIKNLIYSETAATAVEYAVMLALIIMAALTAIATFGQATNGLFTTIDTEMSDHGIQ